MLLNSIESNHILYLTFIERKKVLKTWNKVSISWNKDRVFGISQYRTEYQTISKILQVSLNRKYRSKYSMIVQSYTTDRETCFVNFKGT